jgi:hypothetical protein
VIDSLQARLGLPNLVGPVKGTTAGAARLYLDMRDGVIVNWIVQDRAGRVLWMCGDCLTTHFWYPNAVYDPTWTAKGGECCERGMKALFQQENKLWRP